jgi:hypothetical protein
MQVSKEKALNLILSGLATQYVPSFMLGTFVKDLKKLPSLFGI